eukprot:5157357-Amphidinium_carterae.1
MILPHRICWRDAKCGHLRTQSESRTEDQERGIRGAIATVESQVALQELDSYVERLRYRHDNLQQDGASQRSNLDPRLSHEELCSGRGRTLIDSIFSHCSSALKSYLCVLRTYDVLYRSRLSQVIVPEQVRRSDRHPQTSSLVSRLGMVRGRQQFHCQFCACAKWMPEHSDGPRFYMVLPPSQTAYFTPRETKANGLDEAQDAVQELLRRISTIKGKAAQSEAGSVSCFVVPPNQSRDKLGQAIKNNPQGLLCLILMSSGCETQLKEASRCVLAAPKQKVWLLHMISWTSLRRPFEARLRGAREVL